MKQIFNLKLIGAFLLGILLSMNISVQGQGGQGGPGRGRQMTEEDVKERVDQLAETLDMTDLQKKKILDIDMDFYNKMQIERQKMMNMERTEENRILMREKMMKMNDERNKQYKEVLDPEQYKKFIEIQEKRRSDMRQQRQQNNPDANPDGSSQRGRGRN